MNIGQALEYAEKNKMYLSDNTFLIGAIYTPYNKYSEFQFIELSVAGDGVEPLHEDDYRYTATLSAGNLQSYSGIEGSYGGDTIKQLLRDAKRDDVDFMERIQYRIYDSSVSDLIAEAALNTLFPSLPNADLLDFEVSVSDFRAQAIKLINTSNMIGQ